MMFSTSKIGCFDLLNLECRMGTNLIFIQLGKLALCDLLASFLRIEHLESLSHAPTGVGVDNR